MQIKKILTLITSLFLLVSVSSVIAQDSEENDGLAQVVRITAKAGHEKALEEAITNYHHYMGDKKGAFRFQWYSIITGPDTGSYIARSGSHNWEDFDAKNDWQEAASDKFAADVQPHIASVVAMVTRTDQDLSSWPDSMEGYKYILLNNWQIKQGQANAFNEGLKKIHETLQSGGWPNYYAFVRTVSGGHGNPILLVSPRKSYADMAPKEPKFIDVLNKAMGEEEAKTFLAEWSQTYKAGGYYTLQYLPKLSDYGQGK